MSANSITSSVIRVGIVGAGNVARNNYLPWLSRQEGMELYCYSRTPAKTEAVAAQFGACVVTSPADLAAVKPDVVFILTNEAGHVPVAEALQYGVKRLFIEKPLQAENGQADVTETDFFTAREMLRKAQQCGTEVAMNFNYRFFTQNGRLQQLIRERNFGKLQQSSWNVHYACWSHCIDLLRYFGGAVHMVSALQGMHTFGSGDMAGKDVAAAFTLNNGAVGTIIGTSAPAFQLPLYHATLNFEHGTAVFSDLDSQLTLYHEDSHFGETSFLIPDKSRWIQYAASFENSLTAYFHAVRNGEPPPVSGQDGLAELQFEAALRRSAATGKPVEIEKEFPLDI